MKTLFNEYEAQNSDGNNLSQEIEFAIHPIIVKYQKQGFLLRDVLSVIVSTVNMIVLEMILVNAADMHKKERMEKR